MPVDYSKWDALELSDDSDIEVHPNVDKRSFIRAKQTQIHMERQQRKLQIEAYKHEKLINEHLLKRISGLVESLESHTSAAESGSPGEAAFRAVMETAGSLDPKDDQPPPPPEGVDAETPLPTYTRMLVGILDQVNKSLDEKKIDRSERYEAMVKGLQDHKAKVLDRQVGLDGKISELELKDKGKITSESYRTGFDSSHVNKSMKPSNSGASDSAGVELLNPNFAAASGSVSENESGDIRDDEDIEATPEGREFANIVINNYYESHQFIVKHPQILTERETDALLVIAFNAQMEGKTEYARQCVHQARLLQYCRSLGPDGVSLFFKRIQTPGHQAHGVFMRDVEETAQRIKERVLEILKERENEPAGVEQIQLHPAEPGSVINLRVPDAKSDDLEEKRNWEIFDGLSEEMKKALRSGSLDEVNVVLGKMDVAEAEDVVEKLSEGNILNVENQVLDATTEEGKQKLKEIQETAAAAGEVSQDFGDDPE